MLGLIPFLVPVLSPALVQDCGPVPVLEAKLLMPAAVTGDRAGYSVAIDGDLLVTGAIHYGVQHGQAYVFARQGGVWQPAARLRHPFTKPWDQFGYVVDICESTVAVGAPYDNIEGVDNVGTAHVFTREGSEWELRATLSPTALHENGYFGRGLSLDGDRLAVSWQAGLAGDQRGAVCVFEQVDGSWVEDARLEAAGGQAGENFGYPVALHGDTLVARSGHEEPGSAIGTLHVFERAGGSWAEVQQLRVPAHGWLRMGWTLDLADDRLLSGCTWPGTALVGGAWLFERVDGSFVRVARFESADGLDGDHFGRSVALLPGMVFAGAERHEHQDLTDGSAYLFRESADGWVEQAELRPPQVEQYGDYGTAMDASGDTLVVGAHGDWEAGPSAGAVYVYRLLPELASFCSGDGTGTDCPCGNDGAAGCGNSTGAGAALCGVGTSSVFADDLVLHANQLPPAQPALAFAGPDLLGDGAGVPFGDGLLCVGGALQRLEVVAADAAGSASWGPALVSALGLAPGELARFQVWYRDPVGGPCAAGFNLSSAIEVELVP